MWSLELGAQSILPYASTAPSPEWLGATLLASPYQWLLGEVILVPGVMGFGHPGLQPESSLMGERIQG
jgi:hypothetical protein